MKSSIHFIHLFSSPVSAYKKFICKEPYCYSYMLTFLQNFLWWLLLFINLMSAATYLWNVTHAMITAGIACSTEGRGIKFSKWGGWPWWVNGCMLCKPFNLVLYVFFENLSISSYMFSNWSTLCWFQDPELEKLHAERIAALKVAIYLSTKMQMMFKFLFLLVLFTNFFAIHDLLCLQ